MKTKLIAALLLTGVFIGRAAPPGPTLAESVAKAELIVVGKLEPWETHQMVPVKPGATGPWAFRYATVNVQIREVLKGKPDSKTVPIRFCVGWVDKPVEEIVVPGQYQTRTDGVWVLSRDQGHLVGPCFPSEQQAAIVALLKGAVGVEMKIAPVDAAPKAVANPATDFDIQCRKRDDRITAQAEGDRVVLDIVSPSGIGGAQIVRKAARWPAAVMVRIHLAGLEAFGITSGKITLSASVLSHGDFARQIQWTPDEVRKLDPALLRAFTADGRPTDKLPGPGGWFELSIPNDILERVGNKLEVNWIDFYR